MILTCGFDSYTIVKDVSLNNEHLKKKDRILAKKETKMTQHQCLWLITKLKELCKTRAKASKALFVAFMSLNYLLP